MTGTEYQKEAYRTIPSHDLKDMALHGVFGLGSEAGEVLGIFQKSFQGHIVNHEHLKKELGDVLWMVAEICSAYRFNLDDVMEMNIAKLRKRYPEGFDSERSLNRAEGDI